MPPSVFPVVDDGPAGDRGLAACVDTSITRPDANRCHAHGPQNPVVSLPSRIMLCSETPPTDAYVDARLPSGQAAAGYLRARVAGRIPRGAGSLYDAGEPLERD